MRDKLVKAISYQLDIDPDEIKDDHHIKDDLGADSLGCVELVMRVEEEFNIEIDDTVWEKLNTVGEMLEYVEMVS